MSSAREGHLFGRSERHARVMVVTITDTEFPIACDVFSQIGPISEVEDFGAYTCEQFLDDATLPFAIVQATDRGNLPIIGDMTEWMFQFRPQVFLVIGTAGGVWRPTNADKTTWKGTPRGDVVLSEFIHYSDYRKVEADGDLMRHHRLEQPSSRLIVQARGIKNAPRTWHQWLTGRWDGANRLPNATEHEIVVGEQIQDDPLAETQQFLMRTFDRAGAAEMESAGVGQALHSLRLSPTYAPLYLSIRGVSDLIWARNGDKPLEPSDLELADAYYKTQHDDSDGASDDEAGKTSERALWSPRAAEAASAFALALVQRLVRRRLDAMPGHPAIPSVDLAAVHAGTVGTRR